MEAAVSHTPFYLRGGGIFCFILLAYIYLELDYKEVAEDSPDYEEYEEYT